jgi:hypothetical protein
MDATTRLQTEIDGAKEAFKHLIEQNIAHAAKFDNGEKYVMNFKIEFHRLSRRTEIKAEVSYSQRLKDQLEVYCRDPLQCELELAGTGGRLPDADAFDG